MSSATTDNPASADPVINTLRRQNRQLKLLTAAVLASAGAVLLMGASSNRVASFDEMNVSRINVLNADGSRAMVLAARGRLPGPVINGSEKASERGDKPGLVFYNADGDEVGGLIFDGKLDGKGKPLGGVHLSMDRFGGDQQVSLHQHEGGGSMETGLSVYDRGLERDYGALYDQFVDMPDGPQRTALVNKWKEAGGQQRQRLFVGRTRGDSSALVLADKQGRPRIMLTVSPKGEPALEILDESGEVIDSLPRAVDAGEPNKHP